jgi:IS30 family transposase
MTVTDAAALIGANRFVAHRWVAAAGGIAPRVSAPRTGRFLSFEDRETIALGRAAGKTNVEIAAEIGKHPSTVGREIARNSFPPRKGHPARDYRASSADKRARERARRPKPAKLAMHGQLRDYVQAMLKHKWSPEQISRELVAEFPDRLDMRVSTETIYQSLYVQSRGALRRELTACLRTGRAVRRPKKRSDERRGRIPGMISISERPAEAEDRAVPGHWEGDLIIGKDNGSAIGTLVERTTRFCMLLHLPGRHGALEVQEAMLAAIALMPDQLRRSLTWDQGIEMTNHAQITTASGLDIYFCDPHSPWQRGSNENTNGLLRQYFPKGTDLSVHSAEHLLFVADELNGRPRKTLGWKKPREALKDLLVATAA